MKNLLNNAGFEGLLSAQNLPSGWYVPTESLPAQLDSTGAHSGKCSIAIQGDRKSYALRQDVRPPRAPAFIIGGYVKAEDVFFGPGEYAYIYGHILYKGRTYSDATHFQYRVRAGTYTWRRVEEKGCANPKYEIEKIMATCTAKFTSGKIWFDDLFLLEASWRNDLARVSEEAEKFAKRLDEAAALAADVSAGRAQLAALREIVAKSAHDMPPEEGETLVAQAREALVRSYQALSPAACAALWGRMAESKSVEARVLFHGLTPTKKGIEANLATAASINANMLLPSLTGTFDAVYPSQILPVREGWGNPDFLAHMVVQAHQSKVAICPYITCFQPMAKEEIPQSIYATRPELLSVRHPKDPEREMRFPDPANPQVREIIANIAAEVVSRYDVDGIGLDYIRYFDHQAMCYCPTCRHAIRERYGFDPMDTNPFEDRARWTSLREWRAEQITATVKAVRDKVRAVKPGVKLYACVTSDPDYALASFGQDWAEFAQHLDFVVPMNYGWAGADEGLTRRQAATLKGKALFLPAIGGMPEQHESLTPDDWITMIAVAHSAGADGIAIYALGYLRPDICSVLAAGPFKTPAAIPVK